MVRTASMADAGVVLCCVDRDHREGATTVSAEKLLAYWNEHYRQKALDKTLSPEQIEALETSRRARIVHVGRMTDAECERELAALGNSYASAPILLRE